MSHIIPNRRRSQLDCRAFLHDIDGKRFRIAAQHHGAIAIRQIAALPYRIDSQGHAEVMLITSRETRRWILPKGNLIRGLDLHQAAAREAYEEAGIKGVASPVSIGEYRYLKRRRDGTTRDVAVAVFPLAVVEQVSHWPEQEERETRWFELSQAAAAIEEPELSELVAGFRVPKAA